MKVLPPRTLPFDKPLRRRHRPTSAAHWSSYRPCLRWDFGFSCGFCLLHEADFFHGQPGARIGVMTVEHRTLRSRDPNKASDFENCFFACRLCNRARGTKPSERGDARLLDPTREAWADHFELIGDHFRPAPGDADAEYTHIAYDLNDPEKVSRREARRELLADRLLLLSQIGNELSALLDLAELLRSLGSPRLGEAWKGIVDLRRQAKRALQVLRLYRATPEDAPKSCRCDPLPGLRLPEALEQQALEVEEVWSP